MDAVFVKNRADLRTKLEDSLKTAEEEGEDEFQTDKRPKSYIVESNLGLNTQLDKEMPLRYSLTETEDSTLKIFRMKLTTRSGVKEATFYLDVSDERFWILHSLDSSNTCTDLIYKLVTFNPSFLDFPWFYSKKLEEISHFGKETGFSLRFNNRFLDESDEEYEEKLRKISMRFWGGQAEKVINHLKDSPSIAQGVSLSNVGLRYRTELGSIKTNISTTGKFVVMKGDSIDSYFNLINKVKNNYKSFLIDLEKKCRIDYKQGKNGFELIGGYSIIDFEKEIEDLSRFTEILTSCSTHFRLWGVWNFIEKDYVKINAIDLHTNHKIDIELSPNWMRLFLPNESCGNVISRLFTNLQSCFDSKIRLTTNENEKIIK
ncbi:MAG: hypothetical protein MSIBF_05850 [Candidatus Altiarchaeales archaeon IMC4]|nr:MAG: hypothetical protein MSIBF_05850 [Candidatus Altiarchaeales archaeon IMC4]